MIIAYLKCPYNQMQLHKDHLKMLRRKHKVKGEVKWSKVSNSRFHYYSDLVDYFFSNDLSFRAVIVNKEKIVAADDTDLYNTFYFKMYYQLLHHKMDMSHNYNVYIDIKDTRSVTKLHKLKEILQWNSSIRNFQFIRSHESSFMQLTDLIMGALNYHLRGLQGSSAKSKIVQKLMVRNERPLNRSTPKYEDKFNLFFIELK